MKSRSAILMVISSFLFVGCSQLGNGKFPFLHKNAHQKTKTSQIHTASKNDPLSLPAMYFNQIKQVNGKNVIQNPTNVMALVNKNYILPSDYIPTDLVRPNVAFSFGNQTIEKSLMRKVAANALESMFNHARRSGINLYAVSGFRSFNRQKGLFDAEMSDYGEKKALQAVAIPGSSEHQTGLAMDIASSSTGLNLTTGFSITKEGIWLEKNAHRFGFILRYPKGKEKITNYEYEPWHFRFVGIKAATIIYNHNWTLEEYFNKVKKI